MRSSLPELFIELDNLGLTLCQLGVLLADGARGIATDDAACGQDDEADMYDALNPLG